MSVKDKWLEDFHVLNNKSTILYPAPGYKTVPIMARTVIFG